MPARVAAVLPTEEGRSEAEALQLQPNESDGPVVTTPMTCRDRDEDDLPVMETFAERKARRRSHYIVYFTTFIMTIGFSIILTGIWPYLQQLDPGVSKEVLGWVIAANPLGQMIASPLFGFWGNKAGSSRGAFLLTVAVFIIGNAIYAILSVFGSAARGFLIFSRFLVGVSSANVAIIRSYISASTTLKERTTAVAFSSAAQGLGFIIGPGIQSALAMAFSHGSPESSNSTIPADLMEEDSGSMIQWNMYTAAGWVAVLLASINIFLFLPCCFQEYPIAAKEAQRMKHAVNDDTKLPRPDYSALICMLVSFFITLFIFVLLETLLVPMCIDLYAWSDQKAVTIVGIGLSIAGAVSIIMFGATGWLTKIFDERKVFIFGGLLPLALSMMMYFPMGSNYPKMQNCTVDTNYQEGKYDNVTTMPDYSLNMNLSVLSDVVTNNISDVNNELLSRRRRYVVKDSSCHDFGCPPEQEWCLYTPIIEMPQMAVAGLVATIGYPVAFALSSSIFSKLLGPKPQGVWMGVLTSTGSLSRVAGPIFVSYMYTVTGTRWTFGVLFVIITLNIILVSSFYKRLVPMKVIRNG